MKTVTAFLLLALVSGCGSASDIDAMPTPRAESTVLTETAGGQVVCVDADSRYDTKDHAVCVWDCARFHSCDPMRSKFTLTFDKPSPGAEFTLTGYTVEPGECE